MNTLRRALFTSVTAASVVLLAAGALPSAPQDPRTATPAHAPVSADGNYSYTDPEGNYQAAITGAVLRAHDALSHANGAVVNDYMFNWQVYSVTGVRGGIAGRHDITVTVHVY